MVEPSNPILSKMLERLFAAMVNGPAMNCRPHASRQRIDLTQLTRLKDVEPGKALLALLGEDRAMKLVARVPVPARSVGTRTPNPEAGGTEVEAEELSPEERAARQAWNEQQSLFTKARVIADDARTYEQDTGVHALNIGFPILSLPPGSFGGRGGVASRRVLAPIAFIPATLTVKAGARQTIELACHGDGVDLVVPNVALLAWLEQQVGQPIVNPFDDEAGTDPWREIVELVRLVAQRVDVEVPPIFDAAADKLALSLSPVPKAEAADGGKSIFVGAVLGLFPTSNQGLLKDTREMIAAGATDGPIVSFVRHGVSVDGADAKAGTAVPAAGAEVEASAAPITRRFQEERLISLADPCQTRAVGLARTSRGLVVHGPPGTGKSQTIANIIGDHVARGERVLFVCDKRTALDVVADRLNSLGLGDLCATVHDPQRDQREFYRSVREQLDNLANAHPKPGAAERLARVDAELQALHDQLSDYHRHLMGSKDGVASFHQLVGHWLAETADVGDVLDWRALQTVPVAEFERHKIRLKEVLERGEAVNFATNPWRNAAGISLAAFLANPMHVYRAAVDACVAAAERADATADPYAPPFSKDGDLASEAAARQQVAAELVRAEGLDPATKRPWAQQPVTVARSALAHLAAAESWTAVVKERPIDPSLRRSIGSIPSAQQLADNQRALRDYASAFASKAALFAYLRAAAPDANVATIGKWMAADHKTIVAARKRLEGAAQLAAGVETTALDASLLSRFEAAPMTGSQVFEALAALNAYVDVANKWYAALQMAKKKAAEPIVRHFGLSLNAQAAGQVRQFLTDRQKRSDLRSAIEAATGEGFEAGADDGELLTAYEQNRRLLAALANAPAGASPGDAAAVALPKDARDALNSLISTVATPAAEVLRPYGLEADAVTASRVANFFTALEARVRIAEVLADAGVQPLPTPDWPDEELLLKVTQLTVLLTLLSQVPESTPLRESIEKALSDPAHFSAIVAALSRSNERVEAVAAMLNAASSASTFGKSFMASLTEALRFGRKVMSTFSSLRQELDSLEGVLRVREGGAQLPNKVAAAVTALFAKAIGAAIGYSAVRKHVLAGEIARRLQACPQLQDVDGHRLRTAFDRFRQLSESKKEIVRDLIQDLWVGRQKQRLLATTGTRLNSIGADLRRRLTMRGERAMRLRQVIAHGAATEGGDPLFDLRPVWMASPETVAQLFPRAPIFDVVVFDEASQCRLEEALPVLTRAHRVVIAGDPKQLPPTRFFESAVVASEDADPDTDQELFESHQGDVEDLLTAALGLDVHQSYLDVHYRSRNSDLIGFSNEHFYSSRLQAIPSHPRNRTKYAPITLYRAEGVYEKRTNEVEANTVCKIVRDLLKRAKPPSIGIASFNLVQRDLIVEKLEEMAEADEEFAARLAEARERRGPNSSEGLFVKNLENVQGDERDHIIISTTYGPDRNGKFRRAFGPLGSAGGGRRLNVLVTRARDELHIVTSIPQSAYASLPPVPPGSTPGGAWLLFAYLSYAEQLQREYELNNRIIESTGAAERGSVTTKPTRHPSSFAKALAGRLATDHNHGSDVHWGNEGFAVDVALHHPTRPEDVTVGVLCDMTRFTGSDDPVEWDVFRTGAHEAQGWRLHRVWTPHFFRDAPGGLTAITAAAEDVLRATT